MINLGEQTRRKMHDATTMFQRGQCDRRSLLLALNNRIGLGPDERALIDKALSDLADIDRRFSDERDQSFFAKQIIAVLGRAFEPRE